MEDLVLLVVDGNMENASEIMAFPKKIFSVCKYIRQYNDVELNGLGMDVKISLVDSKDADKGHLIRKAKIEIVLGRPEKISKTTVTATPNKSINATA